MGLGFCVLFIGLIVILSGFYEVYEPFLAEQTKYFWSEDYGTLDNNKFLVLEEETPPDITRSEP